MKEKIKNFFFSRFALIALIILYIIFSGISFLAEYFIGKTDLEYTTILRITTIILDIFIIGAGIFTWIQVRIRKRFRTMYIFQKRMILILYLADTLAIFIIFFLPYVARLLLLFFNEKISYYSLIIDMSMGIAVVITIGFLIKKILRKIKKFGKNLKKWKLWLYSPRAFFWLKGIVIHILFKKQ